MGNFERRNHLTFSDRPPPPDLGKFERKNHVTFSHPLRPKDPGKFGRKKPVTSSHPLRPKDPPKGPGKIGPQKLKLRDFDFQTITYLLRPKGMGNFYAKGQYLPLPSRHPP